MELLSHFSDLRNLFLTLRLVNQIGLTQLALTVTIHMSIPPDVTGGIHSKYLTLMTDNRTCTRSVLIGCPKRCHTYNLFSISSSIGLTIHKCKHPV